MFIPKNKNKTQLSLIYPLYQEEVAKVLMYGNQKYQVNNWQGYTDINDLVSAIYRHTNKISIGSVIDESGYSHFSHIGANCMIMKWLYDHNKFNTKTLYYYQENSQSNVIKTAEVK